MITKKNCKNVNNKILVSKILLSLKFFTEKKMIKNDVQSPKIKE